MPGRIMTISDVVVVDAPLREVWEAIEDPVAHAGWHPFVVEIGGEHRLGADRTCSVVVGGKPGETTERCVEYEADRRIIWLVVADSTGFGRMVSDWRAGFELVEDDRGTAVTAESSFRPDNLFTRAMLPLIRRKFHSTQRGILGGLQESVEARRTAARA
jgi:hypothetical protein